MPLPSTVDPAGTGSSTTTQLMSDCASSSRCMRATSPRDQVAACCCSMGVTVRLTLKPVKRGFSNGSAEVAGTNTQGRACPSWVTLSAPGPDCHGRSTTWKGSAEGQLTVRCCGPYCSDVLPETGVDSNDAENFSMASTPQALATVVFQWPDC